jgi:hypothetical protein
MRKQFINFIEKLDIHANFLRIVERFITACGITLLLCFYSENIEEYTRENIAMVVSAIFLFECLLSVLCKVVKYMDTLSFSSADKWQDSAITALQKECTPKIDENRQIIATHEAGHAVMAYLNNAVKFDIDLSNNCVNTAYDLADVEEIKKYIMVIYAGAASEELIFGQYCSGCFGSGTADFESAVRYIKGYIVMTDNTVSKTMLEEEIGQKVITLSNDIYAETLESLTLHKSMVRHLAGILLTKNYLKTEEVKETLEHFTMQQEEQKETII